MEEHVVSKNVQFIATAPHFPVGFESFGRIVRSQIGLKQALVTVRVHLEVPFLDQAKTRVQILAVAEQSDQDIDGRDGATYAGAFHLGQDGTDEVEAVGEDGPGEDEEEAVVGEGVVAEVRRNRGAKLEEPEGQGGVV